MDGMKTHENMERLGEKFLEQEAGAFFYYIQKKIAHLPCRVTTIARGIAFGGELEYADEMTLSRSIANRLPVQQYVK